MYLKYLPYLVKRQDNCVGEGCDDDWDDSWWDWGRWVLFGAIVVTAILMFVLCSCITARRRRAAGARPIYGTGWATHGPIRYYGNQGNAYPQQEYGYQGDTGNPWQQNPVPPYPGPRQNDVELQAPGHTYYPQSPGEPVYTAPPGPPPSKIA